jgi:Zn-finger nucleic acid-binding protein
MSSMLCPVCNVGLTMSERQGVEIDYCPQCRGVWLDRGELDKIIERGRSNAALPPAQPTYQPDRSVSDQDPRHRTKRRKSFLEELFD